MSDTYGRAYTRAAIATYFSDALVPYVGTVYPARPVIMEETAYYQTMVGEAIATTASGSSAVLVVNIPTTNRQRRADTGRGAVNDSLIHDVSLEIFFANSLGDGLAAQADYDGIVDALTDLVRADATMGDNVWSAGEYTSGIAHEQAEPYTPDDGLTVCITGLLRFEAWQWAAGNVTAPA